MHTSFALYFKDCKLKKQLTIRDIAKHTNLSRSYLVELQAGTKLPSYNTIQTLVNLFGVPYTFEPREEAIYERK